MNRFLLLLVALSIAWIIIVFNTSGLTGLLTAQTSGNLTDTGEATDASQEPTTILFSGYRFDDTEDVRQYTELMAEYITLHEGYLFTEALFNECFAELLIMGLKHDREFGGKPRTQDSENALAAINQKRLICQVLSQMLEDERKALEYMNMSISNKIMSMS